ncbi:phosphodiesterase [Blastococcus sp. CT_GayMR20]|uniref:phosphodiesterase n=1 Tax=Blastococcus sp. CT_GayMR20 TaxID=2559609 RepID=UPI0010740A20|nr:phosphodiesterase [Blastococcus sp. CT_GayMR20]TFV92239.1 phosphodiesterase [Blastococcus sp. CT_GayMR20]
MRDLPRTAGRLVGAPLGALARWRGGKPMHPRGAVFDAVLDRRGGPDWGVPWLAGTARDAAVARLSRGAGLPASLPDLLGLAIRLPTGGEPVDLLLTTSGRSALTRLVPVPRRDAATFYSSIMGYRSDAGSIRFAAVAQARDVPSDPRPLARDVDRADLRFTVLAARGLGRWQPIGCLTLTRPVPSLDPDVRFDAVQHPPPGLVADGPMARFRAPAYERARAGRRATRGR